MRRVVSMPAAALASVGLVVGLSAESREPDLIRAVRAGNAATEDRLGEGRVDAPHVCGQAR